MYLLNVEARAFTKFLYLSYSPTYRMTSFVMPMFSYIVVLIYTLC